MNGWLLILKLPCNPQSDSVLYWNISHTHLIASGILNNVKDEMCVLTYIDNHQMATILSMAYKAYNIWQTGIFNHLQHDQTFKPPNIYIFVIMVKPHIKRVRTIYTDIKMVITTVSIFPRCHRLCKSLLTVSVSPSFPCVKINHLYTVCDSYVYIGSPASYV